MRNHQASIRKSANTNSLKAYFLGGFELADKKKQEETRKFLDNHILVVDLTEEQNKE
jgi:hypothetical protein|tara:strand:+ start:456 stop:626 length:171 start_codon:yes stop_codon:yes gene_type:complete